MNNLYTIRITGQGMDISWAVNESSDLELLERVMVKVWRVVTEKEKAPDPAAISLDGETESGAGVEPVGKPPVGQHQREDSTS